MILVLFGYCITGAVQGEKGRKSIVRSLMEQPTQFSATRLSAQGSYGDKYQACSSRILRVASEREQEAARPKTHYFLRLLNVPKF